MATSTRPRRSSTVDAAEVERFSALAADWWDPLGKMGVLHKFNPVRLGFIKEVACRHFERDGKRLDALAGLRILDIGCGGGILSEPLARLGAAVVGADPAEANIAAATDQTIVIPGHGPVGGRADVGEFRDMLVGIRAKVAALKKEGRSLHETIAARPTAAYDAKWGQFLITPAMFTGLVYAGV